MPLAAGSARPLVQALPALIPVLALFLGLDIYCLVNLTRATSVRNAPKLAWVIVILCVSAPLGAILYLFFGMDRTGAGQKAAPAPRQAAPPAIPPMTVGSLQAKAGLIVATTGLTRNYGGNGLFDVDLAVPRGCVYGLVGLNGAGKTTLLSIVAGTRHADRGSVSLAIERRRMAVCPDVPEFDGWLTAAEVVDLARSLVAPEAGPAAVDAALRAVGLADAAGRRVGGFSRGMQQRLGLACALTGDPELLILDEPTSALDPAGRAEMLALVAAMRGTRTVIFSSHILADVQRVADQVGILRDGRMLYQGGTRELMDNHLTPSWLLRIAERTGEVAAALAEQPWVARVETAEPGVLRVDATTIEDGERGIPAVVAACGARQVSCEPAAADLEAAFLALTGARVAEAA
ncbi:MAG TPA: ATP-binding cassette domain-containing protein [Streptosporangiaceae bacterium]|nr:ATP-binding cassette domain-containing protein [Streptosporangiaceae bacterium]